MAKWMCSSYPVVELLDCVFDVFREKKTWTFHLCLICCAAHLSAPLNSSNMLGSLRGMKLLGTIAGFAKKSDTSDVDSLFFYMLWIVQISRCLLLWFYANFSSFTAGPKWPKMCPCKRFCSVNDLELEEIKVTGVPYFSTVLLSSLCLSQSRWWLNICSRPDGESRILSTPVHPTHAAIHAGVLILHTQLSLCLSVIAVAKENRLRSAFNMNKVHWDEMKRKVNVLFKSHVDALCPAHLWAGLRCLAKPNVCRGLQFHCRAN